MWMEDSSAVHSARAPSWQDWLPAAESAKAAAFSSPDASVAGRVCNLTGIDNAEKIKS